MKPNIWMVQRQPKEIWGKKAHRQIHKTVCITKNKKHGCEDETEREERERERENHEISQIPHNISSTMKKIVFWRRKNPHTAHIFMLSLRKISRDVWGMEKVWKGKNSNLKKLRKSLKSYEYSIKLLKLKKALQKLQSPFMCFAHAPWKLLWIDNHCVTLDVFLFFVFVSF